MSDKKVIYIGFTGLIVGAFIYVSFFNDKTPDQNIYTEKESAEVELTETSSSIETDIALSMQTETEIESTQIDHYSVNAVFDFYEQQARMLLEEYQYHEANAENSSESQYALYLMHASCVLLPRIETQIDLDSWLLEMNLSPDLIDENIRSSMSEIGRCYQLNRYVGYEIDRIELIMDSLKSANENGHPIAMLTLGLLNKVDSLPPNVIEGVFNDAYLYAKDYPQHKAEVYGAVSVYFSGIEGRNFDDIAVGMLGHRERLIYQDNMSPEVIDKLILSEMEAHLLSYDIDEILSKADQFSKAMENGDWSFLGLVKPVDSET